jgi:uncharacterized Zn ribbon protein
MAKRKFQIGDRVQVVKDMCIDGNNHGIKLGRKGKITNIDTYKQYSYGVQLRNGDEIYFNAKELELVERKGNK